MLRIVSTYLDITAYPWAEFYIIFHWLLPSQFSEVEEVYPGWAQFIGAVIILIAILPIPIILIGRLILYQSARDEAISFFKSLRSDTEDLFRYFSSLRSGVVNILKESSPIDLFHLRHQKSHFPYIPVTFP